MQAPWQPWLSSGTAGWTWGLSRLLRVRDPREIKGEHTDPLPGGKQALTFQPGGLGFPTLPKPEQEPRIKFKVSIQPGPWACPRHHVHRTSSVVSLKKGRSPSVCKVGAGNIGAPLVKV